MSKGRNRASVQSKEASKNISICVVKETPLTYSETFIVKHAEMLKTEVYVVDSALPRDKWYFPMIAFADYLSNKIFKFSTFNYLRHKRFAEYLKRRGVQVVLAEFGPTGVAIAKPCREMRVPLVVHFHGYDATRNDVLRKNRKRYHRMFKIARRILVVSEDMKQDLIHKLRAPRHKVRVNLYGLDFNQAQYADQHANADIFLSVGRFVDKKSPTSTLLAFHRVWKKHPHARLIMVGHGKLLETSRRLVADFGMESAVEFKGVCSHEEVFQLMKHARCFVQHSLTSKDNDKEGTPVGILEASASGLPVVSTLHAGIKQAVIQGKTGFLVEEGDIIGMAEHMEKFVGNPGLAAQFGKSGYTYVRSKYSNIGMRERLYEIFNEAIAEQNAINAEQDRESHHGQVPA